jgi:hypothetical protein
MPCELCRAYLHDSLSKIRFQKEVLTEKIHWGRFNEHIGIMTDELFHLHESLTKNSLLIAHDQLKFYHGLTPLEQKGMLTVCLRNQSYRFDKEFVYFQHEFYSYGILKVNRTDKMLSSIEQFLECFIVPLIEDLSSVHNDHSVKRTVEYFNPPVPPLPPAPPMPVSVALTPRLHIRIPIDPEYNGLYD